MKRIERFTYWNNDLSKGVDAVFVIQDNKIVTQHIDHLTKEDWRR